MRPCQLCGRARRRSRSPRGASRPPATRSAAPTSARPAPATSRGGAIWPSCMRDDQHDDDQHEPRRELTGAEDAEEDEPAHAPRIARRWSLAAEDPDAHDREAVGEVVADRDRRVERRAAAAARLSLVAGVHGPPGLPDAERIEDREHRQQARADEQDPKAAAHLSRRAHDPTEQRRRAPRAARARRCRRCRCCSGLGRVQHPAQRPDRRQHAQHDDRPVELRDPDAQPFARARCARARRRAPPPMSTNWSASLGRSSGISTPRSMPPMNGCVARNTYAAHTGRFATSTKNARRGSPTGSRARRGR